MLRTVFVDDRMDNLCSLVVATKRLGTTILVQDVDGLRVWAQATSASQARHFNELRVLVGGDEEDAVGEIVRRHCSNSVGRKVRPVRERRSLFAMPSSVTQRVMWFVQYQPELLPDWAEQVDMLVCDLELTVSPESTRPDLKGLDVIRAAGQSGVRVYAMTGIESVEPIARAIQSVGSVLRGWLRKEPGSLEEVRRTILTEDARLSEHDREKVLDGFKDDSVLHGATHAGELRSGWAVVAADTHGTMTAVRDRGRAKKWWNGMSAFATTFRDHVEPVLTEEERESWQRALKALDPRADDDTVPRESDYWCKRYLESANALRGAYRRMRSKLLEQVEGFLKPLAPESDIPEDCRGEVFVYGGEDGEVLSRRLRPLFAKVTVARWWALYDRRHHRRWIVLEQSPVQRDGWGNGPLHQGPWTFLERSIENWHAVQRGGEGQVAADAWAWFMELSQSVSLFLEVRRFDDRSEVAGLLRRRKGVYTPFADHLPGDRVGELALGGLRVYLRY